ATGAAVREAIRGTAYATRPCLESSGPRLLPTVSFASSIRSRFSPGACFGAAAFFAPAALGAGAALAGLAAAVGTFAEEASFAAGAGATGATAFLGLPRPLLAGVGAAGAAVGAPPNPAVTASRAARRTTATSSVAKA